MKKHLQKFLLALPLLVSGGVASAQIGGAKASSFDLMEYGRKVGEVYVPARVPGTTSYVQHWVLFPNYQYPGPKSPVTLHVMPRATNPYASEDDFFQRVMFDKGSKYVRVTASESDVFPR